MTETKIYKTIADLRAALPDLPEDAVIRDRDGDVERRSAVRGMLGTFAPYTVTYEVPDTPAPEARPGFTLGQKVRRTGPDHHLVRRGEFYHVSRQSGHGVTLEGLGDYTYYAAEFEAVDESPAPLDPSKVKAGDMVTLSLEGAHVTDVVAAWEYNPASGHYRAYLAHDPDPFDAKPFRLVGNTAYALTDHQPAPEPEPEWLFEFMGEGGPEGDEHWVRRFATRAEALRAMAESAALPELGDFEGVLSFTLYTDVTGPPESPLVVIDPAKVDVDALTRAVFDAYDSGSVPLATREANAIDAALKFLGIEAS